MQSRKRNIKNIPEMPSNSINYLSLRTEGRRAEENCGDTNRNDDSQVKLTSNRTFGSGSYVLAFSSLTRTEETGKSG